MQYISQKMHKLSTYRQIHMIK